MPIRVSEKRCKTLLGSSGITDYSINCYTGCSNGCRYCYAKYVGQYQGHEGELWGSYVDVKVNALEVLEREIRKRRPGHVFVSSACDAWQEEEETRGLSRDAVGMLLDAGFEVLILTKSRRLCRDLPGLKARGKLCVGVSLTAQDERLRQAFEPRASSYEDRLSVLAEARDLGFETMAMMAPLWPHLTDTDEALESVLRDLSRVRPDRVTLDFLNPRSGVWPGVREVLGERYPFLVEAWRRFLFDPVCREERKRAVQESFRSLMTRFNLS